MDRVEHLSSSSFGTYTMCPRKFRFRYVDGVRSPSSPAQVFGSASHECVEARIVAGGGDSLLERWPYHWEKQLEERYDIDWGRKTPEAMDAVGKRLFGSKAVQRAVDRVRPYVDKAGKVCVERYFEFEIEGVGVPFVGYVDIVEDDLVVADFKTSSREWKEGKSEMEMQPLFYIAGLRAVGIDVRSAYRHYVLVKGKPQVQRFEVEVAEGRIEWALDRVREVWRGMESGVFPMCSQMAWWCSPKWCEYWTECGRV